MSDLFTLLITKQSTSRCKRFSSQKGQSSFEYLIVIGIMLMLILPGFYLFYSKLQSTNDQHAQQQLSQLGNDVMSGVSYVYPFGSGTKTTLEFTMPEGVANITVRGQGNPLGTEFVITTNVRGTNNSLVYFSKYSMYIGNCTNVIALPSNFITNPGKKSFQIISCGSNVSIYQRQD